MEEKEIVFKLIQNVCEEQGLAREYRLKKMAQLLNISIERYKKIRDKLLEDGMIEKTRSHLRIIA